VQCYIASSKPSNAKSTKYLRIVGIINHAVRFGIFAVSIVRSLLSVVCPKRSVARGLCVPLLLVCGLWSAVCGLNPEAAIAAEFSIHPSIAVSEEYTDNVFESRAFKQTDFITRLQPGLALKYNAPFWDWDIAYNYDYRYYAKNSRTNDSTHNLLGTGHIKIIDEFLFLDVSDTYSRVSLNIARDATRDSLSANQSDSNTVTASPYFLFHPGPKTTVRTGYRYTNIWYKDPTGIDRSDHSGFVETTYAYSPRVNLTASYTYTREDSVNPFTRHAPYVGARYEYKDSSFVFGQAGYTWFNSKNGGTSNNPFWNAGITHTFGTYSVSLATGVQYPFDPLSGVTRETDYSFALNKLLNRGSIGVSLSYANFSGTNIDVENRYTAGFTSRYELTQKLIGTLAGSIEKYDHQLVNSYTRRIYLSTGLIYPLPRDISLALNYSFIDYYSPGIFADNYQVNRVILEARKTF
jgi:hypothetical protein